MKLRADVEIHDQREPSSLQMADARPASTLVDATTGLKLVLSRDVADFLLGLGEDRIAQHYPAGAGESGHEAVGLLAFFHELGLLSDSAPEAARAQQARYILTDAEFNELPRIRQTVEHARAHTALHREHLASAWQPDGLWDLEDLPLLHKSDLRRHFPRGLTLDSLHLGAALRTGDLVLASTSGSTGERLQVYSDTRLSRLPEDFEQLWGLTDLPRDRPLRTAVLTSPLCSGGLCTRRSMPMQERIAFEHTLYLECPSDPFELSEQHVTNIAQELASFAPDLWLVNPVYLSLLTEHATRLGIVLPRPRAIAATYQYSAPEQQARLSRLYGAPLFQLYAATELGGSQIGISCRHGTLHVRLDHSFVELVRDGARVEPGQLGHPVVTTHHPSMPLVRYQLTDLARFAMTPCACEVGSAWPSLILEGRERDAFVREGVYITTAAVDRALSGLPILLYQLHETEPGVFRMALLPERDQTVSLDEVKERLSRLLQTRSLEVAVVTRLPFEDSGKFRFTFPHGEPAHV